jgi:lysophospholipase L1-like esterase
MKTILITMMFVLFTQTKSDKLLFIGDSMTTYTGGWQHQLSKRLGSQYTNLSVSGRRTLWMRQTLETHLKTNSNYKTCFIYGGINDGFAYVSVESALQNVQTMVDLCNQYGIKPVVIIGYRPDVVMVNTRPAYPKLALHRERYMKIQEMFRTRLKGCQIIPMEETITRADTDDGVHFKASGHRKLSEWVYKNYLK